MMKQRCTAGGRGKNRDRGRGRGRHSNIGRSSSRDIISKDMSRHSYIGRSRNIIRDIIGNSNIGLECAEILSMNIVDL